MSRFCHPQSTISDRKFRDKSDLEAKLLSFHVKHTVATSRFNIIQVLTGKAIHPSKT